MSRQIGAIFELPFIRKIGSRQNERSVCQFEQDARIQILREQTNQNVYSESKESVKLFKCILFCLK